MTRRVRYLLPCLPLLVASFAACGEDSPDPVPAQPGAGTGGSSGKSGKGGSNSDAGTGGTDGDAGTGGTAGKGGTSSKGGSGGTAGKGGTGGTGGSAGKGGTGGTGGSAGGAPIVVPGPNAGTGNLRPAPTVTQCETNLPAAAQGVCDVKAGTGATVLRGRVIADGGEGERVFEGGEVVYGADGKITCAGCDCSAAAGYAAATTVTCADGVIGAAFINTHDHIEWAQLKPTPHTARYDHRHEWRKGAGASKPKISTPKAGTLIEVGAWGEIRFLLSGTASTLGGTGGKGLLRNLDNGSSQEGLSAPVVDFDTFPLGDSDGDMETTCTYPVKAATKQATIDKDQIYLPHVAEGIAQTAQNEFDCEDGEEPSQLNILAEKTGMIHAIGLTPVDIAKTAASGTAVIWSPRSNIDLYGFTAPVSAMAKAGIRIALGTDWVPSGSSNMGRELACADSYNRNNLGGFFSDYDLYRMVTVDAASVVGAPDKIGTVKAGFFADISIWNGHGKEAFDAVVHAQMGDTALVVRGGKVLGGESDVVAAMTNDDAGCEELDVCGAITRLCVKRDTGKTIEELRASLTAKIATAGNHPPLYDLFWCGVAPQDEPSCTPTRANEFTGLPTEDDTDGDGIANADDLCPTVFSAIKPMDKAKQADSDADGVGDHCDVCPLKANSEDCPLVSGDNDGDGIPNTADNCKGVANPDQLDTDKDGKGDLCDACPNDANPGSAACPAQTLTIPAVRALASPKGVAVNVSDVVVTAVKLKKDSTDAYDIWIQDKTATENAGLMIFTSTAAIKVTVGDTVDASGELDLFNGLLELVKPTVTVKSSGALTIVPIVVDPAKVKTGGVDTAKFMSMLVSVPGAKITNIAAGAKPTDDEMEIEGGLILDDFLYDYDATKFMVGQTLTNVVGPLHFFNKSQLLPQSADAVK